jgi:DNA ligase D-like protein (predicted 3'-phosphoesterase)
MIQSKERTHTANECPAEYRRRRNCGRTPEPVGGNRPDAGREPIFVIQQHRASSMHYEFHVEVDGVLKSCAVPKVPSTDPSDRRLAVLTEERPMDYVDFEGIIPNGEYVAGPVIVWDNGTYRNLKEGEHGRNVLMARAVEDGQIEIWLEGWKLPGGYALIRAARQQSGGSQWLLVKINGE